MVSIRMHTILRPLAVVLVLGILFVAGACSASPKDVSQTDSSGGVTATSEIVRRQGYLQNSLFTFTPLSSNQELEGLMQADGTVLIPAAYEEVRPLTAERFLAKTEDGYVLLNREGDTLLTAAYLRCFDGLRNAEGVYEEGVLIAAAKREGDLLTEWSLVNLDGQAIGTAVWDVLEFHSKGYIHAVRDQKDYLIDYQGNTVVDCTSQVFVAPSEKANPLQKTERIVTDFTIVPEGDVHSYFGVQDASGNILVPTEYDSVLILSPTRIVAQKGSINTDYCTAWIFDEAGQVVSDGEYNTLEFCALTPTEYTTRGIAYFADPDTGTAGFYLVDQDGNRVLDQPFESLSFSTADRLSARQNGETFTMDLEGNRIE